MLPIRRDGPKRGDRQHAFSLGNGVTVPFEGTASALVWDRVLDSAGSAGRHRMNALDASARVLSQPSTVNRHSAACRILRLKRLFYSKTGFSLNA